MMIIMVLIAIMIIVAVMTTKVIVIVVTAVLQRLMPVFIMLEGIVNHTHCNSYGSTRRNTTVTSTTVGNVTQSIMYHA